MLYLDRDDVFDLLRLFNLHALSDERRSAGEERRLRQVLGATRVPSTVLATATVLIAHREIPTTVLRVGATGFRIRSERPLHPQEEVVLRLAEPGEPDYLFPCRVAAAPRQNVCGLLLVRLPTCALPRPSRSAA